MSSTYNDTTLEASGLKSYDMTDQQKKFLGEDNVRAVLVTQVESPEVAAKWNNNVQAYVEGMGHGIPANNSSDPRHTVSADAEYNYGAGGKISMWPSSLGIAATFDPAEMKKFGEIASKEYRALGIATALSPQVDLVEHSVMIQIWLQIWLVHIAMAFRHLQKTCLLKGRGGISL